MATRGAVLDAVEVALAGEIAGIKVYSPNKIEDIPAPTGDPRNPTTFIAWALGDDGWSEDLSSFGTRIYEGTVIFNLTTEWGGGELDISAFSSEVEALLLAASTADLTFFEARLGDAFGSEEDGWTGRILEVPYWRQEDK